MVFVDHLFNIDCNLSLIITALLSDAAVFLKVLTGRKLFGRD